MNKYASQYVNLVSAMVKQATPAIPSTVKEMSERPPSGRGWRPRIENPAERHAPPIPSGAKPSVLSPTPAAGGPTDEWLTKTMGSYNPNSKRDKMKADRIRSMWREGMKSSDVYADPEYKRIDAEKLWRK